MSDFTTTTNLNLKKPAIGGSSDKWGEYLNENMETIGTSIVNLQNASTSRSLESLNNVLDTTATTGQLLQYDTGNWKAATVTIPDNIQDLNNVTITSPANGQVLAYSTSNSRWENQTAGAATIPDGTITTAKLSTSLQGQVSLILQTTGIPTDNQIVRYDSTTSNWQFEDLPGGTVSALSDTDVSGIGNKDALVYNSTSGNWVSRPLAIADVTNLQTTLNAKLESADISVSSLSDTTITTTADDSLLVYDSSDSKWKNEGPSTVRSTLSLVVGTNVQAQSARLDDISSLAVTDGNFIVGNGTNWVAESGATARESLGLTIGTDVQAYDADTAKYDDTTANFTGTLQNGGSNVVVDSDIGSSVQGYDADTAKYDDTTANFTGTLQNGGSNVVVDSDIGSSVQGYDADTAKYDDATANFTGTLQNGGSNVLVDSDIGSTVQGYDANTAKLNATTSNFTGTLQNGGSNVVVDSDIGSAVQAYDADLSAIAGLSSADGNFIVGSASGWVVESGATARSSLGLGTAATTASGAYATAAQGSVADNALQDVVDDSTPQLGGNLDVNGNSIVSASAGNIAITPDTTGKIILDGLSWPSADGSADQVLKTDGAGNLSFVAQSGGGGGSGSSYIEHSSTISDSLAISSGTNRMYVGGTTFSGSGTMAGRLVTVGGAVNFTGSVNTIGVIVNIGVP